MDLARSAGAASIVQALQPHLGWQDSATVALRVKRGLNDLEQPGGYTKDHAYLSGLTQITAHLSQHPSDLVALMATKWPLQLLDHTRTLLDAGHLRSPTHLPRIEHTTAVTTGGIIRPFLLPTAGPPNSELTRRDL